MESDILMPDKFKLNQSILNSEKKDTNLYFPILDNEKIILFKVEKEEEFVQKLEQIKNKYSYDDIKLVENESVSSASQLPFSIEYGKNKLFDVKKCELFSHRSNSSNRFGGTRFADAIVEVSYYPKIYNILKIVFTNSHVMDLKHLANYFLEYDNLEKFVNDERKVIKENVDRSLLNAKISKEEQKVGIDNILTDIRDLFNYVIFPSSKEIKIEDSKVLVDIDTTKEELEKIREFYYIGKSNKKSIEVLCEYFNKNVNLSKENVKKV